MKTPDLSKMVAPWATLHDSEPQVVSYDGEGNIVRYSPEDDEAYQKYLESLGPQVEPDGFDAYFTSATGSLSIVSSEVYSHGGETWGLVGRGEVTDESNCCRFRYHLGCVRADKHEHVTLKGENFSGKGFVVKVHNHCDRPSCPRCFAKGWANREASKAAERILRFQNGYVDVDGVYHASLGVAEHVILSVSESDWGLPQEKLRVKAREALARRGITGGWMVFHGMRYRKFDVIRGGIRNMRGYYWSPHFHLVGWLSESYSKCRHCTKATWSYVSGGGKCIKAHGNAEVCFKCRQGYEYRTRLIGFGEYLGKGPDGKDKFTGYYHNSKGRAVKADGFIVKVMGERQNIRGTCWYQLNHATYRLDRKQFHIATWFGSCNSNKMVVTKEIKDKLCPICHEPLVRLKYVGSKLLYSEHLFGVRDMICDVSEDGKVAWVEADDHSG